MTITKDNNWTSSNKMIEILCPNRLLSLRYINKSKMIVHFSMIKITAAMIHKRIPIITVEWVTIRIDRDNFKLRDRL